MSMVVQILVSIFLVAGIVVLVGAAFLMLLFIVASLRELIASFLPKRTRSKQKSVK